MTRQKAMAGLSKRDLVVTVVLTVFMAACGGGAGNEPSLSEGHVYFRVQWERSNSEPNEALRSGVDDCADVATVSAAVYDNNGGLLQTGGPWDCSQGQGTISQVPAERYVRAAVVGHTPAGLARYRGESGESFFLPAGGSVNAGRITAPVFLTTLTAPTDGAAVAPSNLTLRWGAVTGADTYVVEIADDSRFDAAAIVQSLTVDASATPSCQPETTNFDEDRLYFWRVLVVDGAGNTSEPSTYRQFTIDRNLLVVTVEAPADNTVVLLGDTLTFEAGVTDSEGTLLSAAELTSIQWTSSIDDLFSNQLAFSTNALSGGDHTITLTVADGDGLHGSAAIALRVNRSPTITLVEPVVGFEISLFSDLLEVACRVTASDPEDGTLSAGALLWELFEPGDPTASIPVWSENGGTPTIPGSVLSEYGIGIYTLTLRASDSNGAVVSVSRTFEVTGD